MRIVENNIGHNSLVIPTMFKKEKYIIMEQTLKQVQDDGINKLIHSIHNVMLNLFPLRFIARMNVKNDNINSFVISTTTEDKYLPKLQISHPCTPEFEMTAQKDLSLSHHSISKILITLLFLLTSITGFSQNIKKVISLAPSITENIYLLGAEDKLAGCTSYCMQAISDGVEQVGSTVNINIEKVLALQPDLVFAMQLTKPQDVEAIRKLGIKVEMIETPKTFDEICEQTIYIGKLIGEQEAAQKIITQTKHTIDSLKQLCNKISGQYKIFFQIGANPIFTVLENTFMNDYILFCKSENIANGMKRGTMTRESVIHRNPDVIIIATMGGFGKDEQEIWNSFKVLNAAKNNKIYLIDSEVACSPTPVNFAKAFAEIYQFIKE
jgi:iron complex transport system substrate-binding protein